PGREDRSRAGECGTIENESSGIVAELPESDQRRAAGPLVRLCSRLVGILPTGRGPPEHFRTGRLDTSPHPGLLLAALGQLARTAAETTGLGTEGTRVASSAQFQRRVAHRGQSEFADGVKQRGVATPRILDAIRPCGHR